MPRYCQCQTSGRNIKKKSQLLGIAGEGKGRKGKGEGSCLLAVCCPPKPNPLPRNFSFSFLIHFWSLGRKRLSLRWFKSSTKTTAQRKKKNSWFYLGAPLLLCSFYFAWYCTFEFELVCKRWVGLPLFRPIPFFLFPLFFSLLHTRYERREEWWWHSWFLPIILHLLLIFHPASP